ncbi:hypothetical protein V1318_10845 [Lysobacter sp. CCNWLW3]|uniref:hypothetical protein n=1 Tax=unclassified Lysobacter TaxID=2635362 RepID=UPI002FD15DA7
MLTAPSYEDFTLVTDDPSLAAKISALFTRPRRYFSVMDGPRLSRPDANNEVVRRRNAIIMTKASRVLLGGLPPDAVSAIRPGWKNCIISDQYDDHILALRGLVKRPKDALRWGRDNLGVGVYQARLARKELQLDLDTSPSLDDVHVGRHLLVACERGDVLSEVIASNLAFSCGASFSVFPELPEDDRIAWLEEIYALGEGADLTGRFGDLCQRARAHLKALDPTRYKTILFVTSGFPWGIALPEVATTHMYRYPDLGRSTIEGIWASQNNERSARTALLIDPQTVEGSEIPAISRALMRNGTLTRTLRGASATKSRVQFLLDLLPHDIIVLSSHAGDAPGDRITYRYPDTEGNTRTLVVDRVVSVGSEPIADKLRVMSYIRFHSLDGVDWRDRAGKAALPVGSAINSWSEIVGADRNDYVVAEEPITRVTGSMAMLLHDGIWLFASHGFASDSSPLFINNSCWSWHEISLRAMFAGARGYLGTLFPITDAEAQEVTSTLFGRYIDRNIVLGLWLAQRDVYAPSMRRPYVLVGLPFVAVRPNTTDPLTHLLKTYHEAISHWKDLSISSPHEDVRQNARLSSRFLDDDLQAFLRSLNAKSRTKLRRWKI